MTKLSNLLFCIIPLGVYISLCIYLYLVQRSILYYPTPPTTSSLAAELTLTNEDHRLKIWHVKRDTKRALIYFGGNAEDVSRSIPHFKHLFPDHSLYMPNYRGYGGSTGTPSEEALLSDAVALYDQIRDHYTDITIKGRSLGTAVAVHLASVRPINRLILVTPFDSMAGVAGHHYPYLPVNLLLHDRYDCLQRAESIEVPTLLLIAEHDRIIPRKNSDRLAEALEPKRTTFTVIGNTDHNDIEASPEYGLAIRRFMAAGGTSS